MGVARRWLVAAGWLACAACAAGPQVAPGGAHPRLQVQRSVPLQPPRRFAAVPLQPPRRFAAVPWLGAVAGAGGAARAPRRASAAAPVMPDLYVRCQQRDSCPDGVGMLVVANWGGDEPERCTVSLIGADRALTASHCLAPAERRAGAGCAHTWVAFPETAHEPAESVACAQVLYASERIDEGALHPEHAVLRLTRPLARVPLAVDAAPAEPGSIVTVVSVTPHPVYGSTHALATRLCRAIDSQPAQAALGPDAARVGWLASCPIERGNSGSPVLDYEGRIRAIVHGGTSLTAAYGVTSGVAPEID